MAQDYQPTTEDLRWRESLKEMANMALKDELRDLVESAATWHVKTMIEERLKDEWIMNQAYAWCTDPLLDAIKQDNKEIIELLVEAWPDLARVDSDRPLRYAASSQNKDLVEYFLDKGADVHAREDEAFRISCAREEMETIQLLLDRGANIQAQSNEALSFSINQDRPELLQFLIENGANPHDRQKGQFMHFAAVTGSEECIKILLKAGVCAEGEDNNPVTWAAANGHVGAVDLLAKNGADLTAGGNRPLANAIKYKKPEVVEYLLDNIGTKLSKEYALMSFAHEHSSEEVIDLLNQRLRDEEGIERTNRQKSYQEQSKEILDQNLSLQECRDYNNGSGENALTIITLAGEFNKLAEKFNSDAKEKIGLKDLTKRDGQGRTLISLLGKDEALKDAFNPELWMGRSGELVATWRHVPVHFQDQVDIKDAIYKVNHMTLQQSSRQRRR